jgi:aspartyl-tRNA(Asn)/glutamyl-tRNA(Gln) amidotransferase subunit B
MTAGDRRPGGEDPRPYELVIGIETHVELKTESKMFCGCQARWFGAPPNTLVCPVCLGLPGALPVPNRRAIELAITAGLALHCETPEHTKFDRKNYLYPDLPKGYQISQYDLPLSVKGWLELPTGKRVRITRAHLEEDTGTLKHGDDAGRRYTLVDFNRSGVPLLEIVSEPDMSSADEGEAYVRALRDILIFSGVSEMRLEEGAGRFDVNVSIRFQENGKTMWPPQSEIKNLNSYQALREAVAYESDRLWQEWRSGGEIRTRTGKITVGWSPERGRTYLQRSKEDVEDYRYFPEPDLVSLAPSPETVAKLRLALPEMPADRRARFVSAYGLSDYDARILVSDRALADYYEAAVKAARGEPKAVANWVIGDLTAALKRENVQIGASRVGSDQLAELVQLIGAGTVSVSAAKRVFSEMWKNGGDPRAIVNTLGLAQTSDEEAIKAAVDEVIRASPKVVEDYKRGNTRALGALVGPVMKRLGNKANAAVVNRILIERMA